VVKGDVMKLILSANDIEEKLKTVLRQDGIDAVDLRWLGDGDPVEAVIEFKTAAPEEVQKNPVLVELEKININLAEIADKVTELAGEASEMTLRMNEGGAHTSSPKRRRKKKSENGQQDTESNNRSTDAKVIHPSTGKMVERRLGPNESHEYPG
jgi:hypothetical protein